jgi:hypothetical protein
VPFETSNVRHSTDDVTGGPENITSSDVAGSVLGLPIRTGRQDTMFAIAGSLETYMSNPSSHISAPASRSAYDKARYMNTTSTSITDQEQQS